ncbi:MAG TPA: hypothetical protein VGX28_11885 [Frankiaceae bacterium]|jgi:hypothetical protein|nr:hypothetical protein [Frankiaceae bacterium]
MRVAWAGGVAAVAAAGLLVAPTLGTSRVPPAPPVPPKTLTVDGVVVGLVGVEPVVAVRLGTPSTLVVYAGSSRPGPPAPCEDHTEVRLVAQDAAEVRVAAFRYATREPVPENHACALVGHPPAETALALAAPLGSRRVLANDREVVVHDPATVLRATYLPRGVAGPGTVTFEPESATWTTVHDGAALGQSVRIVQAAPPLARPSAYRVRATVVRGHRATFGEVFGGWCVWWTERERLNVGVCAQGTPVPATREELVRVAEGLA